MSFLALIVFALFNNAISVIYTVLAVHVLWRLAHEWRSLVDQTVTQRDTDLAWKLGFFLLTPIGVMAHESAHLLTARALGAEHTSLTWLLYWGYVTHTPRLSAVDEFAISAAGPGAVHGAGLVAFALVAGRLTRRDRISLWAELVKTYPGQRCQFGEENAARLGALESSPTRFLPGVRQELLALRHLRDWVDEHNREIEA